MISNMSKSSFSIVGFENIFGFVPLIVFHVCPQYEVLSSKLCILTNFSKLFTDAGWGHGTSKELSCSVEFSTEGNG